MQLDRRRKHQPTTERSRKFSITNKKHCNLEWSSKIRDKDIIIIIIPIRSFGPRHPLLYRKLPYLTASADGSLLCSSHRDSRVVSSYWNDRNISDDGHYRC